MQLTNTLFFLKGIYFGLRGGTSLSVNQQFTFEECNGKKCLRFRDIATKTLAGRMSSDRI